MIEMDMEARASQFTGALSGLADLIDSQVPGLSVPSETIAPLLRLLALEAEHVVPNGRPLHRAAANDEEDMEP